MSSPFKDWAMDQAIDNAVEKAEQLGVNDDYFVDWLAAKEFEKLLDSGVCADDK